MQGARTFFSEIISSISDLRFTRDGRFLVSRDYMTLKLWDIRMETGPVSTHNVARKPALTGEGLACLASAV